MEFFVFVCVLLLFYVFFYFAFVSRKFSDEIPPDILNPSIAICRVEDLLKILQKKVKFFHVIKLKLKLFTETG
jgi:hypothetical protein